MKKILLSTIILSSIAFAQSTTVQINGKTIVQPDFPNLQISKIEKEKLLLNAKYYLKETKLPNKNDLNITQIENSLLLEYKNKLLEEFKEMNLQEKLVKPKNPYDKDYSKAVTNTNKELFVIDQLNKVSTLIYYRTNGYKND